MEDLISTHVYGIGETFALSSISSDLGWNNLEGTTLSDYEFTHWTKTEDDVEPFLSDECSVVYNTVSNDLYAQWGKAWFKFTYDKNHNEYLYFQSEEEGSKITLKKYGSPYEVTLVSSENGTDWESYTIGDTYTYPSVGSKFYLRKANSDTSDTFSKDYANFYYFSMTGKIAAHGNIQWLLDCTGQSLSCTDHCYFSIFFNCTSLTQSPELPATTLASQCYYGMFYNCTSLSSSSELTAQTLADHCYSNMFEGCTSLTQSPELPATTLADNCYFYMFYNCNHLSVTTDSTKQGTYQILSVSSTTASNWGNGMFTETAGDFTGTPTTGTAYYCYGN